MLMNQMRTLADDLFDLKQKRKGADGKAKGNKAERVVAQMFTAWTGQRFSRVPASGGLRFFKDNGITGDIICPQGFDFPFNIEVKFYKDLGFNGGENMKLRYQVKKFWQQCLTDAGDTKYPLLVCRDNSCKQYYLFTRQFFKGIKIELNVQFVGEEDVVKVYCLESILSKLSYYEFKQHFVNPK